MMPRRSRSNYYRINALFSKEWLNAVRWVPFGVKIIILALFSLVQFFATENKPGQGALSLLSLVLAIGDCSPAWIFRRKLVRPDRLRTVWSLTHLFLASALIQTVMILVLLILNIGVGAGVVFLSVPLASAAHHVWIAIEIFFFFNSSLQECKEPIKVQEVGSSTLASVVPNKSLEGPFAKAFRRQQQQYVYAGGLKRGLRKHARHDDHDPAIEPGHATEGRFLQPYRDDDDREGTEEDTIATEGDEEGLPLLMIRNERRLTFDRNPLKKPYHFTNFDALALPCLGGVLLISPVIIIIDVLSMFCDPDSLTKLEPLSYILLVCTVLSFSFGCVILIFGLRQVSLDDTILQTPLPYLPRRRNFLALCIIITSIPMAALLVAIFPFTITPIFYTFTYGMFGRIRFLGSVIKGVVRIKDIWPASRIRLMRKLAENWLLLLIWIVLELVREVMALVLAGVLVHWGGLWEDFRMV